MTNARNILDAEAPAEPPEKVSAVAVKVAGRIYTGPTHILAYMNFYQDPEVPQATKDAVFAKTSEMEQDGFLTNRGRFVNRQEAYELALQGKQLAPGWDDPQKAADFTDSDRPQLDSGWMESWALPNMDAMISLVEQAQKETPEQKAYLMSIVEALQANL